MAIEINVRSLGGLLPDAADVAVPAQGPVEPTVLSRHRRINLSLRRRRMRRLQQALGTAAWVAGSSALLFFAAAGVLSFH